MRIDAHQHFWDPSRFPYPWMPPDPASPLRRDFLPHHLHPILSRNKFDGSVVVQATMHPDEAPWLLSLARENLFILGVVGWVDLTDANIAWTLDELQRHPKFVGVRHPVHDESNDRWLVRPDVIRGLRELARRDIPYDLLFRPQHLPLIPELVDAVPDLRMVIDHIAKPGIKERMWEPWASHIARASEFPQVFVKISGMITEADWHNWKGADLQPYVHHVLRLFTVDRCMFGSDWPVCLLSGTWKEALAGFTQAHGPIPKEIRIKITGETAAKFYKLQVPREGLSQQTTPPFRQPS
jgi:L-fuconolactonase